MRTKAREAAYKLIFQYLFNKEEDPIFLSELKDSGEYDESDLDYIKTVFNGVIKNFDEFNLKVSDISTFERMFKCDTAVILLSLSEQKFCSIKKAISINEAVEIAKIYGTEKSPAFVNGILGKLEVN